MIEVDAEILRGSCTPVFFVNIFYLNKIICAEIDGGKSLKK